MSGGDCSTLSLRALPAECECSLLLEQAYFAPYSLHRHMNVIAEMQSKQNVCLTVLGKTLDGRDIDCLRIGGETFCCWAFFWSPSGSHDVYFCISACHYTATVCTVHIRSNNCTVGLSNEEGTFHKRQIWIIARQHPGETMAEWAAEGAWAPCPEKWERRRRLISAVIVTTSHYVECRPLTPIDGRA